MRTLLKRPIGWSRGWGAVGIVALAVTGGAAIVYATRLGPWAYGDSTGYITVARNLLRGIGLGMVDPSGEYRPLSHFPPLYPLMLSAGGAFHVDLLGVARISGVILFASLIGFVGWGMQKSSGSAAFGVTAAGVVLTSSALLRLFAGAVSEPLFLVLTLVGIGLLVAYLQTGETNRLVLSALAVGLAWLTRYAGAAWIVAGAIAVVLLGSWSGRRRWTDGITFAAIGATPMLAWLLFLAAQPVPRSPRVWVFEIGDLWNRLAPFRVSAVNALWASLPATNYLDDASYRTRLVLLSAAGLGQLALLMYLRRFAGHNSTRYAARNMLFHAAALSLIFVFCYELVLAASWAFSRPSPDVNVRIMAPLYPLLILGGLGCLFLAGQLLPRLGWMRTAVPLVALILVAYDTPISIRLVRQLHATGEGYTSQRWRSSETIQVVRGLPAGAPLVSNQPDAILLLTGRPAYEMSELVDGEPRQPFPRFGDNLEEDEERAFIEQGAALVLFNSITGQLKSIYADEAETRLQALTRGLYLFARVEDGAVYLAAPP